MDQSSNGRIGTGEMKILGIFAHPDDETILIGGTLAMLTSRGAKLHVLSATRGEGGELGEPALVERQELGKVREKELRCAVKTLGGSSVSFMGYVDPTIEVGEQGLAFEAQPEELIGRITRQIIKTEPDVLITHGSNGEYGHPAHLLVHQSVLAAAGGSDVSVYGISAAFSQHARPRLANEDDPAHIVVDVSNWLDKKIAAAQCHRTQHALFLRRSSQEAGRQLELADVLMRLESLHRFLPTGGRGASDPFSKFLIERCSDGLSYVADGEIPGE
ncbi:MAG: PIG-L deacetylase family protein [Anaerolineales bacterium]|jgi:LmbE family N-acetylglucosaminyl deacetylase